MEAEPAGCPVRAVEAVQLAVGPIDCLVWVVEAVGRAPTMVRVPEASATVAEQGYRAGLQAVRPVLREPEPVSVVRMIVGAQGRDLPEPAVLRVAVAERKPAGFEAQTARRAGLVHHCRHPVSFSRKRLHPLV